MVPISSLATKQNLKKKFKDSKSILDILSKVSVNGSVFQIVYYKEMLS